jgi:anti-sigma B factor antagonist
MALNCKARDVNGVTILDLSGQVSLGAGSPALRQAVKQALDGGPANILLNLRDVDYIDSSGLGELVAAYTSAKNAGGQVKLLHPTEKVHAMLKTTKLDTIFDVHGDESGAVASFGE